MVDDLQRQLAPIPSFSYTNVTPQLEVEFIYPLMKLHWNVTCSEQLNAVKVSVCLFPVLAYRRTGSLSFLPLEARHHIISPTTS
jgi:hypothetical protein